MSLQKLHTAVVGDEWPFPPSAENGNEAFEAHIALATRITKAAGLHARASDGDGQAWIRYLVDFFPAGRNSRDDANLLWHEWRTPLVKTRAPGPNVPVTHGRPDVHLTRDDRGRLCIDLESMYYDFGESVDRFVLSLKANPDRAAIALERLAETTFTVEPFRPSGASFSAAAMDSRWGSVTATASVSASMTTSQVTLGRVSRPTEDEAALSALTAEARSLGYLLFIPTEREPNGVYIVEAADSTGGLAFEVASAPTRLEAALRAVAALRARTGVR